MNYERLTHVEHILKRTDTYVGSLAPESTEQWVRASDGFTNSRVSVSPALVKIFDEILVNAVDQYSINPKKVKKITVETIGPYIFVGNFGVSIPIKKHETEKSADGSAIWIPELIFGHLLTSSNYNDSEQRVTGGRNGYGAKLANVFSKEFSIQICDGKKKYSQKWRNNMSVCEPPEIISSSEEQSVLIGFSPDSERFGDSTDFYKVIEKRTWDAAMWCSKAVIELNGKKLVVNSLEEYARMHLGDVPLVKMHTENFDIVVGHSKGGGFQQLSWVNGICTNKGGSHVEKVVKVLTDAILTNKNVTVKPFQVRSTLAVFIRSVVINPTFSSQTKAECTSRITDVIDMKPKFIKDVLGTGIYDELVAIGAAKIDKDLKKTDGSKKSRITGIPKLDDANWAGTHRSHECTLIITEGDSAKTLAIAGLGVVGRNAFGVFPLRGKPRNVRDATVKQVTENEEFSNLKKIIGLQHGKVYNSLRDLRYGRLMIMTDADLDGSHIKGLVLNMFHVYWPKLIELGFVVSMVTPVIKAGKEWYFTEEAFKEVVSSGPVKYYKGLGTSTSAEAKEYFKQIDRLTVAFVTDPETDPSMHLAFAKTLADDRKLWLTSHMAKPPKGIPYGSVRNITVTDFIRRDMANFSAEDIKRSIPSCVDGLKPSQRKVIYACLKKNLTSDMKVAQLAGYVAEQTAYHHGEASLQGTIVNLAQNFVGSNNLNLLIPSGQFGTRLMGGKDSASARYIFTRLAPSTRKVFDPADGPVLSYLVDDGLKVEPEYYVPVVPMVLVNGAEGIGTGFSCSVPPFDLEVIKHNIRCGLKQVEMAPMVPYFKGFKGKTRNTKEHTWVLEGIAEVQGNQIHVTELPPGKWIQDFKEHLDDLVDKGTIQKFENQSTETTPDFRIWGTLENPVRDLGLTKTIHTSNMYLIGPNGAVKKYEKPEDILIDYMEVRLSTYRKRKSHMLKEIETEIRWLTEKARFIHAVAISRRIRVFNSPIETIHNQMREELFAEEIWQKLLDIKTYQYTCEEVEKLRAMCEARTKERELIKSVSVVQMWEKNLDEL